MRVDVTAHGSKGDVSPFAWLGQTLAEATRSATTAAHIGFENPMRDAGLTTARLPRNPCLDPDRAGQARLTDGALGALNALELFYTPLVQ